MLCPDRNVADLLADVVFDAADDRCVCKLSAFFFSARHLEVE